MRIELSGILAHRDIALRAVSAACKLVTPQPYGRAWNDFQVKVVSAVGEAFNNIVEHGYRGDPAGLIQIDVRILPERIEIDMRDWGTSFDPKLVPTPDLDELPEGGLGLFIIQSFMELSYSPGHPNVLTLSKTLTGLPDENESEQPAGAPGEDDEDDR